MVLMINIQQQACYIRGVIIMSVNAMRIKPYTKVSYECLHNKKKQQSAIY